jgi:peptidoglycan/xylan/chitin deacetylase (PgdA/CDA1 family)
MQSLNRRKMSLITMLLMAVTALSAVTFTAQSSSAAGCSAGYVGLTYDDGPTSNTSTLLATLRNNGLRATFFNIGTNARNNPSLVQAEVAAGMWVGNHSWTHPHLVQMSQSQIDSELSQTQQAIASAGGGTPRLFRPPYGETNSTLKSVEAKYGLTEIIWDVDSQDWNGASTAAIVSAAGRLTNGQVILMHDGYATTNAAVSQIAGNLAARNLCAGMISPSTGRAVAPDGGGGNPTPTATTAPPGGGTCSASYAPGTRWSDRFNGQVTISGASSWTATVTVGSGQKIIATWNGTASWGSDPNVMTMKPNGSGNTFGFTVQTSGNFNAPSVSCRVG